MSKQSTRRRATRVRARTLAVGVAVAALVGIVGAGQALAAVAPPDERVLERQGIIDRHTALGKLDEPGRVTLPPQLSSEDKAAATRTEPPAGPAPQLGDQQVAPIPVRTAPPGARGGQVVVVVVAALLLTVGAATTWRVRHRRPQPESTA
jgi:hypothetical protein